MSKGSKRLEQHYNANQVAKMIGTTPRSVLRFRDAGELSPWVLLGKRPVFPESTVVKFMESRQIGASA